MLGDRLEDIDSQLDRLEGDRRLSDVALVVGGEHHRRLVLNRDLWRAECAECESRRRLRGAAGLGVVVDVEDEAVVAGVADLELERGALLELAESSTGSPSLIEKVARPSAKRRTVISEAPSIPAAASSKPLSWAKSLSGPTSTSTGPA